MRLLSRSRELKRLDSIFKSPRQVQLLDSMLWLRAGKAEPVRKVQLAPAPARRPAIDFGPRRR